MSIWCKTHFRLTPFWGKGISLAWSCRWLALFCISASAISAQPSINTPNTPPVDPPLKESFVASDIDIETILAKLTLEEKIGQMLFLGFGGTLMDHTISKFLRAKKPGGVAFFRRNIQDLTQTLTLIRDVQKYAPAGIPMFISVDQEGANVVRLHRYTTIVPSNMAVGAAGSNELSQKIGAALGKDLRMMGFNMNLAPVLDVNSNPKIR